MGNSQTLAASLAEHSQSHAIDYDNRIVAYLDILGFRNLVMSGKEFAQKAITTLEESLSHSIECVTGAAFGDTEWCSIKLFSDCFCISCADSSEYLERILSEISYMQWFLAGGAVFISGGLSLGSHYESQRIIFSEGLINAYELQIQDPFPRVLIGSSIIERINGDLPEGHGKECHPKILRAPDGIYFVDYLQGITDMMAEAGNLDECFSLHKDGILRQINANARKPRVLAKYKWLSEYHNFKFTELYDKEDWVDSYYNELLERLTIPSTAFPSFGHGDICS